MKIRGSRTAPLLAAILLAACGSQPEGSRRKSDISVPPGDVAGEVSWSPGSRCAAFMLFNRDGHSPLTTTRVAVVTPGTPGYREIRFPEPHARFSTVFEKWEGPEVLRLHATTLDGDIPARYSCASGKLELIR